MPKKFHRIISFEIEVKYMITLLVRRILSKVMIGILRAFMITMKINAS